MLNRHCFRLKRRFVLPGAVLVTTLMAAGSASANLIFEGPAHLSGTGLGAVNTITTAHDPGGPGDNNGTESSCAEFDGTGTVEDPCHFLTGEQGGDNTAINNTFALSDLGTTNAGDLALLVNVAEQGNDGVVDLSGLYLSLYNGTTNNYFYYMGPTLTLTQDDQAPNGTGQSGFLFTLDAAQAAAAASFCGTFDCVAGGGMQFLSGSTSDGNESLFLTTVQSTSGGGGTTSGGSVPEPGTLALLAASLIGIAAIRRRKR